MDANKEFETLKEDLFKKFFEKNPHFASYLGLHDPYDYLLPKGDTTQVLGNLTLLQESVDHMKKTIDYDSLNDNNKIDWQVMEKAIEMIKFEVHERRMHELNPDAFDEVGGVFFAMITRDYAPLEKRIDAIIGRLEKMPKFMEEFRSRF
ncbi:DUF885 family protein, partial [Candidatus Bathyarchaeota archaeon]|nr:DUF885 family protein [Candidatus Bathyarchaeota archaeon]